MGNRVFKPFYVCVSCSSQTILIFAMSTKDNISVPAPDNLMLWRTPNMRSVKVLFSVKPGIPLILSTCLFLDDRLSWEPNTPIYKRLWPDPIPTCEHREPTQRSIPTIHPREAGGICREVSEWSDYIVACKR